MPLLSRGNFSGPLSVSTIDRDFIQINYDGSTLSAGRGVFVAVGPVPDSVYEQALPVKSSSSIACSISSVAAKRILQNIPRDMQFGGLLEHAAVDPVSQSELSVKTSDARREASLLIKNTNTKLDAFPLLEKCFSSNQSESIIVNRKRLSAALSALESSCPDSSGEAAVHIQMTTDKHIILRTSDMRTGQKAVAHLMAYEDGPSLEYGEWEKSFIVKRKKPVKRNGVEK